MICLFLCFLFSLLLVSIVSDLIVFLLSLLLVSIIGDLIVLA